MKVQCAICPNRCLLGDGQMGLCGARSNVGGAVVCENYGKLTSLALDPVEKKPLRRFFPGAFLLSAGSYGCNMHCPFCQNHRISMPEEPPALMNVPPDALVEEALRLKGDGNIGIAYTYNEPFVGYEYVMDCARLAHSCGLKNVAVTNGYVEESPLAELLPFIDAMNIDLKGFTPEFYEKLGGSLEAVKRTISLAVGKTHVEVTTLIVPGENDSPSEMERLSAWLSDISEEIPLHVSRSFPCYKYAGKPPARVDAVHALAAMAQKRLLHVYTGNC
ncbi:MAG: AmmeMemoRadiSam system radical SAM enzyme [Clostridiales bacterium]|nr:AmmeMemoRadiSam system radical SAM enzyme [Clostridiales bacterium]